MILLEKYFKKSKDSASTPYSPIFPISVLGSNFNPQNTTCIPAVKIVVRLEFEKFFRFSLTH